MNKYIKVVDGDVVAGYKESYLNTAISLCIWRKRLYDSWKAAGGWITIYDGREYFGGKVYVDSVNTPEREEVLKNLGVDDAGVAKIREIQGNSKISHVYVEFSPHQSFTVEGLGWYLQNEVHNYISSLETANFDLVHEVVTNDLNDTTPYSFKYSADTMYDYINISGVSYNSEYITDEDTLKAVWLTYALSSVFEDNNAVIDTVVENIEQGDGTYHKRTTTTVTITDKSMFSLQSVTDTIFDIIHLSDDPYFYYPEDETYNFQMNFAGVFWRLEYDYTTTNDAFSNMTSFSDNNNDFVIYLNGHFYIDTQRWLRENPKFCMVTLNKLVNIRADEKSGGFWDTFVGSFLQFLASFVNIIVEALGNVVYSMFWVSGGFLLDIAAANNLINKKGLATFKKVYIEIAGNIALIVLTAAAGNAVSSGSSAGTAAGGAAGGSAAATSATISTMDILLYIADGVAIGIDAYNTATEDDEGKHLDMPKDVEAPVNFVFEEKPDMLDASDFFYEYSDDVMDVYAYMQ